MAERVWVLSIENVKISNKKTRFSYCMKTIDVDFYNRYIFGIDDHVFNRKL